MKKVLSCALVVLMALVEALNFEVFILPNSFAPSGVNGICTLIMKLFDINLGYLSILINVPLALLVYFRVSRTVAKRSLLYVLVFSVALIHLDGIELPLKYYTENGTSAILGPLTAGVIMGCIYAMLLKAGAYSGGMDFVALLIHSKHPEKSVYFTVFTINIFIAVASFFVYDYKIEPVLLCIMYSFATSTMAERALRAGRGAIRFEVITEHSEEITNDIINLLHHSATVLDSQGAYSHGSKKLVICVVNASQVALFYDILKRYPGSFAVMNPVSEVLGNFKHISKKGTPDTGILDKGDSVNT